MQSEIIDICNWQSGIQHNLDMHVLVTCQLLIASVVQLALPNQARHGFPVPDQEIKCERKLVYRPIQMYSLSISASVSGELEVALERSSRLENGRV